MRSLLCLILVSGCAAQQTRPTKTADSAGPSQRYKSGGPITLGPDLDFGPDGSTVVFALLAVGGVALAVAIAGQNTDEDCPSDPLDDYDDTPLWSPAFPAEL